MVLSQLSKHLQGGLGSWGPVNARQTSPNTPAWAEGYIPAGRGSASPLCESPISRERDSLAPAPPGLQGLPFRTRCSSTELTQRIITQGTQHPGALPLQHAGTCSVLLPKISV